MTWIEELKGLYSRKILTEMNQKFVDQVKKEMSDHTLPFDNIFGNKLRIILPIEGVDIYNEILDDVKSIPNYHSFNPSSVEVIKEIEVDPKFGGGKKIQKLSLGKAINMLKIDPEKKKKYLNWVAKYIDNIPKMNNLKDYVIVLSRNPVDVLRMSDIGDISSCHAQGGAYFHCAIQEAKTGGPIAYVVNTEDLKNMSDDDFQMDEIFEDKERGIKGIIAISRTRIRRYRNTKTNEDLAVPEMKSYGAGLPGIYETIKRFLVQTQGKSVDEVLKNWKDDNYILTGGTYEDTENFRLFDNMFDTKAFHGGISHEDTDEITSRADQMEDELRGMLDSHSWDHVSAWFDVDQEEEYVGYSMSGNLTISLGNNEISSQFIDLEDSHYVQMVRQYDENSKYYNTLPYPYRNNPEEDVHKNLKFVKYVFDNAPSNFTDYIDGIRTGYSDSNVLYFNIQISDNSYSTDTDDFDSLCDVLDKIEDEYETIRKFVLKGLARFGLLESNDDFSLTDIEDRHNKNMEILENLDNFVFEEYDEDTNCEASIAVMRGYDSSILDIIMTNKEEYTEMFNHAVEKYINTYWTPPSVHTKDHQMSFKNFFESYSPPLKFFNITSNLPRLHYDTTSLEVVIHIALLSNYDDLSKEDILLGNFTSFMQFLDKHFFDLDKIAQLCAFRIIENRSNNPKIKNLIYSPQARNLNRVYGKFVY